MINIERANKWNYIVLSFYDIERTTPYSSKRWLARHYAKFAEDMCRMYCDKAVYGKEV